MASEVISYDPVTGYTFGVPVETTTVEQRVYTQDELTARRAYLITRQTEITVAQELNDSELELIDELIALADAYPE